MFCWTWNVDQTKILTRRELAAVLADLNRRADQSVNVRMNLVIVRLACGCGLRASEIGGLVLDDVRLGIDRPHLRLRTGVAKGDRARSVPLWWDAGTLANIASWIDERGRQGAHGGDPVICSQLPSIHGRPLNRHVLRRRFRTACKCLGTTRLDHLTIHDGRHTFISHALAGERTLAEVRQAAGHSNVATTSAYLHVGVDDDGGVGDLFG